MAIPDDWANKSERFELRFSADEKLLIRSVGVKMSKLVRSSALMTAKAINDLRQGKTDMQTVSENYQALVSYIMKVSELSDEEDMPEGWGE